MRCRLYVQQPLQIGQRVILPADQTHYLRSVMRLQRGDAVLLFNGEGGEFGALIDHLNQHAGELCVQDFFDPSREMGLNVHIIQAACRNEKIEHVLQKSTELGAASLHIVRSERSTLKLNEAKLQQRLQRWQKIVIEAAEQSGRTRVPSVSWHARLSDLPRLHLQGAGYVMHPAAAQSWQQLRASLTAHRDLRIAIGPEGGWSPAELQMLTQCDFTPLQFGPRIMRTETAAPAILAALQALL